MNKLFLMATFLLGALVILWMAWVFLGVDAVGLGVTLMIGGVYAIGVWELLQFRRATQTLEQALTSLSDPLEDLAQWLAKLHPSLQSSVRLRIEGAQNGLPAPIITPYLVGLLVMLGLLGTFVGMVVTLKGAVIALEGSSELEAIRAGLAAPIEGLGLAFGTSVAGVAASAMLGLLSTVCRRERLLASHSLDTKIAAELRSFSAQHHQQLALQAIREQAQILPTVADRLSGLASNLEEMGTNIAAKLVSNQDQFQRTVTQLYQELNASVDQSLKTTLVESAQLLSASVQPLAEQSLAQLNAAAAATQQEIANTSAEQLNALHAATQTNAQVVRESVEAGLAQQTQSTDAVLASVDSAVKSTTEELQKTSQNVLGALGDTAAQWAQQQQLQITQISTTMRDELSSLRVAEEQRGNAAVERLSALQGEVTQHLASLGQALEEPLQRLIETASQAPKAAAEVIEKLRGEMSKNFARDNALLEERTRLLTQLEALTTTLEQTSHGQRDAIDSMIERSAATLNDVGMQFGQNLAEQTSTLTSVVEQYASSSVEMASLGDGFSAAVSMFNDSNSQLIEGLTGIEAALEQATNRSDEQLNYYVSQAREIIDHNLLSHQEIIDALRSSQHLDATAQAVNS